MGRVFQDRLFGKTISGGFQVARNVLQKTQALMGATRPEAAEKMSRRGTRRPH